MDTVCDRYMICMSFCHRFLDWMDCCCAGGAQTSSQPGGEELLFPVSSTVVPCRDAMLQHPRTKSCVLLAQLPSSICLDCGYLYICLAFSPYIY